MRRAAIAVMLAVTAVAVAVCARAAAGAPSASGGTLAFGGLEVIDALDVDGGGVRRLASHTAGFGAWSPDGRQFVFLRSRNDVYDDLEVVAADGTRKRRLARFAANYGEPAWSPDGRLIAFDRCKGRPHWRRTSCAVWVIAPDGTGARRVTRLGLVGELAWAPDSRTVAIVNWDLRRRGIFVANVDGGPLRRLTRQDDESVAWSPDGTRLAFARNRPSGRSVIALIGAEGGGLRRLTRNGDAWDPSWSPDGTAIAYAGSAPGVELCEGDRSAIYRVSPDGTARRRLTPYRPQIQLPKWSPDGTRIAYELTRCGDVRRDREGFRIAVIDADTTGGREVMPDARALWGIAWQPR